MHNRYCCRRWRRLRQLLNAFFRAGFIRISFLFVCWHEWKWTSVCSQHSSRRSVFIQMWWLPSGRTPPPHRPHHITCHFLPLYLSLSLALFLANRKCGNPISLNDRCHCLLLFVTALHAPLRTFSSFTWTNRNCSSSPPRPYSCSFHYLQFFSIFGGLKIAAWFMYLRLLYESSVSCMITTQPPTLTGPTLPPPAPVRDRRLFPSAFPIFPT